MIILKEEIGKNLLRCFLLMMKGEPGMAKKTSKLSIAQPTVENKQWVALYTRVSTDYQFEEGYSLDAQEEKLKKWCELKDYDAFKVYADGGWSGSNLKRPMMQELIEDIHNRRVKAVVVYKLDRLSRSQKDTLYLLEDVFIPNGVDFISLNENFDTSTSYGRAMIGILSVFAQLERENIRERTRMGMYERVKDGYWMGGAAVPFGYDYDPGQDILVPNAHADDVRSIFRLYLDGYSTTQLAAMFPVSGDRHITQILDRITYTGRISYKGEIFDGRHEAIIDEETFEKAQLQRKKRSTKGIPRNEYLFSGMLYCGKCGAKMRYQKWGKKLKIYCYSQMKSRPEFIKDPDCDNMRYDAEDVEAVVLDDLFKVSDRIQADETPGTAKDPRVQGLEILRRKKSEITARIKKLYNLYAADGNDILLETIQENQRELDSVDRILENEARAYAELSNFGRDREMIKNLRERWDQLTIREQQRVVRVCIDKILIKDGKVTIKYSV